MKLIPAWFRQPVEWAIAPIVNGLIEARIHPNLLTTVGFLVLVASGVAFGMGAIRLGGGLLLASGVVDMFDGRVARGAGIVSRFGAFYDSTVDRIGEAAVFTGIAYYFMQGGVPDAWRGPAVVTAMLGVSFGLVVSYARARAEGLGLSCQVGIIQRAERILGLGVPTLFVGAGRDGRVLLGLVVVLTVASAFTVAQRIHHVYRLTAGEAGPETAAPAVAGNDRSAKGRRGDRHGA